MDTITNISFAVIGGLFVLTIVVFVHELGHFLVARWCGVAVKAFSIGFGPEIVGFNDRHGTRWKLSWIPLGGYVKFIDDENVASANGQKALEQLSEEDRKRSLQGKPLAARAAVVAAGPIANFLFAVVVLTGIYAFYGEQLIAAKVDAVTPGSAAQEAGFLPGDRILSIDGRTIDSFNEMQEIVSTSPGISLTFVVDRGGQQLEIVAVPERKEITTNIGKVTGGILGIQRSATTDDLTFKHHDPIEAFGIAVSKTYDIVTRTLAFPFNLARGRESADQIGGPILIAQISGQFFAQLIAQLSGQVGPAGSAGFLFLIALLSASIGAVNLFPIPMLDGGHLLFYAIEGIKGRPLSEGAQEVGFRIGLGVILILMIFALKNDVMRLL